MSLKANISGIVWGVLFLVSGTVFAAESQMILGKEYSVVPGEVPGTFDCRWGDEKVTWKRAEQGLRR